MIVTTRSFGEMEIKEENIVKFVQGIPGFEQLQLYALIQTETEIELVYLQSVEDGNISFALLNPFFFVSTYDVELSETVLQELEIQGPEDVEVWTIVTFNRGAQEISLNLLAPLILNRRTRLGKQVILHSSPYKVKHRINIAEVMKAVKGGE